jgi:hypothetical protein
MALKSAFTGLHLIFRMLGLTGLMVLIVAAVLWQTLPEEYHERVVLVGGGAAAAVVLALLVEVRGIFGLLGSRRVGLGSNVLLQVLLAAVLVGGANWWSFHHYRRYDWTWDKAFTLDPTLRYQLAQLRGDTDIVIYQQYVSFTQRGETKQDKYDLAAHKKIVEKVKDLAELFQDLGPRFHVQVLDIQDDNFDNKLAELKKSAPELAAAVEKAPENSIFFHAARKVQRLAFHDVYQIDKVASQDDNGGQGNLVLNYQGELPIARKILNIEENPPRIATAVVHPVLTMSDRENLYLTMNGAKKALDAYGFDCKDLLMRKVEEGGGLSPDPAVLTFEEGRYEQIEEELTLLNESIEKLEKDQAESTKLYKRWKDSSLAELNKTYAYVLLEGGNQGVILRSQLDNIKKSGRNYKVIDVDDDDKQIRIKGFERDLVIMQNVLEMDRQERDNLKKEKKSLNADELAEKRRITDVEIKMKRELADRDLLIVPRFTAINIPRGERIANPNRVHKLDEAQLKAIKYFLKEGKAVLFLLGPINEPEDEAPFREPDGDELEKMLAELGFTMPKQTILFNAEAKDYNERKVGVMFAGRETEIPSVKFEWQPEGVKKGLMEKAPPHAIRDSLNLTSRAVGAQQAMELRIRHPRPVYVQRVRLSPAAAASVVASLGQPGWDGALASAAKWLRQREITSDDSAVLFVTSEDSWNEEQPFITKKGVPRFEPAKEDDPKKFTLEEERRGPFPIAVAMERSVPSTWFDDGKTPPKARIAVIGSGGIFTGQALSPIKEKLLLDVVNWLVGRDDLLARERQPWRYPRVHLEAWQMNLWQWGTRLGLPLLFVYLGAMMWLVRRMR